MKTFNALALSVSMLLCLAVACKKSDNPVPTTPPNTPPPDTTKPLATMNINLTYGGGPGYFELVISETGGKVLLDTVPPYNGNIVAALKTNQTLVDVTYITYDSSSKRYVINTNKGVNPSNWTSLFGGGILPSFGNLSSSVLSTTLYTNIPTSLLPYSSYMWITDYSSSAGGSPDLSTPGQYLLHYDQYSKNNYVYFLMPMPGLYNFHLPKGIKDTVDFSHPDTAVKMNFNKPAQYTVQNCMLFGIMDTTDFSKSLWLYSTYPNSGLPDIEYPRKFVQKYEFGVTATNANNGIANYFSYGDSIPSTLPLVDESAYSLTSIQNNNFSVKFNSVKPTFYYTRWQNPNILWLLYASPDSAVLNPVGLLSNLKSKRLQGQDLSSLALTLMSYENVPGLDYPGYFAYVCNPALVQSKRLATSYVSFTKTY